MKIRIAILFAAILTAIMTGCGTTPVITPQAIQATANLGATSAMLANPQYRTGLEAGSAVLTQFCQTNQPFTVADIQAALAAIKVGGKPAMYVSSYFSGTLDLLNAYGANLSALDPTNAMAQFQTGICAANCGIVQSLNATAPAAH